MSPFTSTNEESQLLITDETVGIERLPVEVQDVWKITDRYRGIYGVYFKLIKEKNERSQHPTSWTWKL